MAVLNISAYKFAPLEGDLKPLRDRLRARAGELGLRGTILLSHEGINLFIAGPAEAVRGMLGTLRELPGLADLAGKESWSEHQPFRRMLVRIKREIIAFGVEGIDPARQPAPRLTPRELKQWLDEGRPVTLLDTRNDYEVKLGTFRGAVVPPLTHFRDFPAAVAALPAELKDQPVVTFCTGGIRCEKAAPYMQREGFRHIWQLEGGILKWFEEVGADHWDGELFVFDQRVGLDPSLAETPTTQCWACQAPLTAEEQQSPRFVPGKSCPYCFREPEETMAAVIEGRHAALRRATDPLPGSVPYENWRPMTVPAAFDGATLAEFLAGCFPHVDADAWRAAVEAGDIFGESGPLSATSVVRAGDRPRHRQPATVEPPVNGAVRVLFEDEALLVLEKPAPLPMHPGGRFNRNTLQHLLHTVWAPQKPRPAHRLDANTSGVLLVARTRHVASLLQPQFARREVEKTYLVRVEGHPAADAFVCEAPITTTPEEAGCRDVAEAGEPSAHDARTEFSVLRRDADGTALLVARPVTGRTNQIRLHARHLGHPVVGDPTYGTGGGTPATQTLAPTDPPLCLHAWQLTFLHPFRQQRMTFESPPPPWAGERGAQC